MATQPGDFNLDGVVDETDRDIWLTNVGRVNATWQEGDANYDGMVDGLDYDLWFSSGGNPGSSAPVVTLIAPISAARRMPTALSLSSPLVARSPV